MKETNAALSWVNGQIYWTLIHQTSTDRSTRRWRTAKNGRINELDRWMASLTESEFTQHRPPLQRKFGRRQTGNNLRNLTSATTDQPPIIVWIESVPTDCTKLYRQQNVLTSDRSPGPYKSQFRSKSFTATSYIHQVTLCSHWRRNSIRWSRSHDYNLRVSFVAAKFWVISRVPFVKCLLFITLSSINRTNGENSKQFTNGTQLLSSVIGFKVQ
jgi:hypothetical protein